MEASPYADLALLYDDLFAVWGKDYAQEVANLQTFIAEFGRTTGNRLLDVGCGTGTHLSYLVDHYDATGMDASPTMIEVAQDKLPHTPLYCMEMQSFELPRHFDVITCLFSAIAYVKTPDRLRQTLATLSAHLLPGGVLLVEPWFTAQEFETYRDEALFGKRATFSACRMRESEVRDDVAYVRDHILVRRNHQITHIVSQHEFGLFAHDLYRASMRACGLTPYYMPYGLNGRGLFIGVKR